MKNFISQPFHLVTFSPWPILTSFSLWCLMLTMVEFFNTGKYISLLENIMLLILCSWQWWRDIIRESSFQGYHTMKVLEGMKLSMILFITSEVFFFISFFWSYFHMFLSPSPEIGSIWPPYSMMNLLINPYYLPLLNTLILISSGMFLSMAHFSLLLKKLYTTMFMMILTLIFAFTFTYIQFIEYKSCMFTINSNNFGSTFFMMTGFHGIHVIIGTIFIFITFTRLLKNHFSNIHHFGFESSAWYWHFVDVVWLFLYLFVYWYPFN